MSRARAFAFSLVLTGCSCDEQRPAPPPLHPIEVPQAVLDPILYDARGRLRVADVTVGELALPVGLTQVVAGDGQHVFEGDVPIVAVHAFFRAHLVSSEILEHGDTLSFGYARPATQQGVSRERYDVVVTSNGRQGTRVAITARTTEQPTLSEAERIRRIREAMRSEAQ